MNRQEEILNQVVKEQSQSQLYQLREWRAGFIAGAKWADNNPKEYREKIEQLEIKYFELFKKARQEDKEKLIAEACRWLLEGGYFVNNTETIDDFRKAMEDLK